MKVDELFNMKVGDLLQEYCLIYSPECGYNYGIGKWDDANEIYEEFDLEEEYCFSGDSLIPLDYGFDGGEDVLTLDDMRTIMARLGIAKRQPCPACGSNNYHYSYNKECMVCEECKHEGKPEYEELPEECD